jgi:hypothetical protein
MTENGAASMSDDTPICTLADLDMEITGEDAPPLIAAINKYLEAFARPVLNDKPNLINGAYKCLKCDKPLTGALGTFQWGIVHGEGVCISCGWPCRGYHDPKNDDGESIFERPLPIVLQYHPRDVSRKGDENKMERDL